MSELHGERPRLRRSAARGLIRRVRQVRAKAVSASTRRVADAAGESSGPGTVRRCNLCRSEAGFEPLGVRIPEKLAAEGFPYELGAFETLNIEEYGCPSCGSSDRDRLCALYLAPLLGAGRRGNARLKVVEFAPAPALRKFLKRKRGLIDYRSADLFMEGVDDRVDITAMTVYPDHEFDLFVCSHVLEHVDDDQRAMRELHRILKPGGFGLVLVPIIDGSEVFDEDASVNDESERWRRFGQFDHVRLYSKDVLVDRLSSAGFEVAQLGAEYFGAAKLVKHGITARSVLYVVSRPT